MSEPGGRIRGTLSIQASQIADCGHLGIEAIFDSGHNAFQLFALNPHTIIANQIPSLGSGSHPYARVKRPDNIVGKMTIQSLDTEMLRQEGRRASLLLAFKVPTQSSEILL